MMLKPFLAAMIALGVTAGSCARQARQASQLRAQVAAQGRVLGRCWQRGAL